MLYTLAFLEIILIGSSSTANLTPIPVAQAALSPHSPTLPQGVPSRLRGRVEQQVDALAGSANKVISGVVDSSFGVLRSFLPGTADAQQQQNADSDAAPWNVARPGFGLLRRESGFSIASLAASLPGRERAKSASVVMPAEEGGQMMVEVSSRPGSIRSAYVSDEDGSEEGSEEEDEEGEEDEEEEDEDEATGGHDTRSIRSFESMMAKSGKKRRSAKKRKTLSDRLASMPGLSKFSSSQPTVVSLFSLMLAIPKAYDDHDNYLGLATTFETLFTFANSNCCSQQVRYSGFITGSLAYAYAYRAAS